MKSVLISKKGLFLGAAVCLLLAGQVAIADVVFGDPMMVPNVDSEFYDGGVQISRNGLELYMCSKRDGGHSKIFVSKRTTVKEAWSTPTPLDAPVNPAVSQDFPSLSADGLELYYADGELGVKDPDGYGNSDIWVLTRTSVTAPWSTPENLGSIINTRNVENTPCISADGLELYFTSNVPDHPRNSEILMTTRVSKDDPWGEPVALNTRVNSNQYEYTPFISTDGLTLFFSRGVAKSHVHVSRRASVTEPWGPSKFFPVVNSGNANDIGFGSPGSAEYAACLSAEDPTIYFARGSDAFAHDYNIWQVDVTPIVDFNGDAAVDTFDAYALLDNWGPTNNSLYDIAPLPFGDGVVDAKDLSLLSDHIFDYENMVDANDLLNTESGR